MGRFASYLCVLGVVACGADSAVTTPSSSAGGASSSRASSTAASSAASSGGSGGATVASSSANATSGTTASSSSGGGATGGGGAASSSASSMGGNSSSSAGGGVGSDCAWGSQCANGLYCDAPGCGPGTCTEKPGPAQIGDASSPVCGCDGVTYWNSDVAAYAGAATMMSGACPSSMSVFCDDTTPCAAGQTCNRPIADASQCGTNAPGTCWAVPPECPLMESVQKTACTDMTCAGLCSLIASHNPYYDGSCP